jgi:hypothetical protein
MRKAPLLFIFVFIGSRTLFSNQLTSLEQLTSQNAGQNFAQYFNAIDRHNLPRVLMLVREIYDAKRPIFYRLQARRELNDIFNTLQGAQLNWVVLEMERLLTVQHLKLIEEEKALPRESGSGLSVQEARKILATKDKFDLCD